MKKLKNIFVTVTFLAIIFSCGNALSEENNYKDGTLILSLENSANRLTTPDIDMNITTYQIEGSGPNSETFSSEQDSTDTVFIKEDLREGTWTITVSGKNSEGTIVGSGSEDLEISQLTYTESTITVEPVTGPGSLDITVSFPEEEVVSPKVTGFLIEQEDIEDYLNPQAEVNTISMTFTNTELSNTYNTTISDITNGYYLLVISCTDEEKTIWTYNDLVRVVTGETTIIEQTLTEDDLNQLEGNISMNIEENMLNPIYITLSFTEQTVETTNLYFAFIIADINDKIDNHEFYWFLNGEPINLSTSQANTIFIDELNPNELYEITVIVKKDFQIGSSSMKFKGIDYFNYMHPSPVAG